MTIDSAFAPAPPANELTRPFWQGGLDGELRLQRCAECQHIRYPISMICPRCLSGDYAWEALSGRGVVQSYIVFDRAYHEDWKDQIPYVVALIALEEGPVFLSNVIGADPSQVHVDQSVVVTFVRTSDEAALPQFRPVTPGAAL